MHDGDQRNVITQLHRVHFPRRQRQLILLLTKACMLALQQCVLTRSSHKWRLSSGCILRSGHLHEWASSSSRASFPHAETALEQLVHAPNVDHRLNFPLNLQLSVLLAMFELSHVLVRGLPQQRSTTIFVLNFPKC